MVCGHSFCEECSTNLRRCALCRRSLKSSSRVTNYSLLSLVSKLEQEKREMVDKQIETEVSEFRQKTIRIARKSSESEIAMKALVKLMTVNGLLGRLMATYSKVKPN